MPIYRSFNIRFLGELSVLLHVTHRGRAFVHAVKGVPSVKDTIESLGVPHTEVGAILVDGKPADFTYQILGGEKIRIYPNGTEKGRPLRPKYRGRPRFLADVHLGKLARHLRLLGFDTLYRRDFTDAQIVRQAEKEKRIVLTRDIGLLKNKAIAYGYFVRAIDADKQIREIVRRYQLYGKTRPFSLCLQCNGPVRRVARAKVLDELPPATKKFYTLFYKCGTCNKVYWKGTHHRRLAAIIRRACRRRI